MLPLNDRQLRLVLLHHISVRLAEADPKELRAAGLPIEHLAHLVQLSAVDLNRLASMRKLTLGVVVDVAGLATGLRALALVNETKALEAYFIRNGASHRLMSTLFKMRRKLTLKRRITCGARRSAGYPRLPDHATRERIYREWLAMDEASPRIRYYRLHQAFPNLPIDVLEAVLRRFEATR
jgi:hypothetical protein